MQSVAVEVYPKMTPKKQLHLNFFEISCTGGHMGIGLWRRALPGPNSCSNAGLIFSAEIILTMRILKTDLHTIYGWQNWQRRGKYPRYSSRMHMQARLTSRINFDMRLTVVVDETYQSSFDASYRGGSTVAQLDPIVFISAMASVTNSVSFAVTGSTSYIPVSLCPTAASTAHTI